VAAPYPEQASRRNDWIVSRRSERNPLDAQRPYAFLLEKERTHQGNIASVATVFLTNRECPWRCLMCDLWKNTLKETVPPQAIPHQIDFALKELSLQGSASQIKLYNSGSFFDSNAVPIQDHPAIVQRLLGFERVIVECHPSLIKDSILRFRDLLKGQLEIAMGLETVCPDVLEKLNKRMSLEDFARAAAFLKSNNIALRAFILVRPPFMTENEGVHWAKQSLNFAFDCGASVASLIPTRLGNGALEALMEQGQFAEPRLSSLEAALKYGLELQRGRVFADTWDLERFSDCQKCFPARAQRLERMNLEQVVLPMVNCSACDAK
jgi:radical SAM enzyme (TIGR01210 family)